MLFNSYEFIFAFLPIVLLGYAVISARIGVNAAIGWLVLSSLFFYGYWNPVYLALIGASIVGNYTLARALGRVDKGQLRRWLLIAGIAGNLGALAYFKYAGFISFNLKAAFDLSLGLEGVVLPLAISFFTFQQIAFLVDVYREEASEYKFLHYCLFVTFFPQLIAGPIVHHSEMLPQFSGARAGRLFAMDLAVGGTIFLIGLFKKTVLADGIAQYATPVFGQAEAGESISFLVSWGGALAYTFQLYFDFSGYSDMAIGAARMFGVRLPMNFFSPYKATSIVEFWRRWHMTLSRFLRDYLYIPLGGNRGSPTRRYVNLALTMLLGGLWHGAGWTFVVWGALHGLYLMINHGWQAIYTHKGWGWTNGLVWRVCAWMLTFVAVVVAWVLFRAESFAGAIVMLEGMAGLNGVSLPDGVLIRLGAFGEALRAVGVTPLAGGGRDLVVTYVWVACLLSIALVLPSTQEFLERYRPCFDFRRYVPRGTSARLVWRASATWAGPIGLLGTLAIFGLAQVSEFLYFQF